MWLYHTKHYIHGYKLTLKTRLSHTTHQLHVEASLDIDMGVVTQSTTHMSINVPHTVLHDVHNGEG